MATRKTTNSKTTTPKFTISNETSVEDLVNSVSSQLSEAKLIEMDRKTRSNEATLKSINTQIKCLETAKTASENALVSLEKREKEYSANIDTMIAEGQNKMTELLSKQKQTLLDLQSEMVDLIQKRDETKLMISEQEAANKIQLSRLSEQHTHHLKTAQQDLRLKLQENELKTAETVLKPLGYSVVDAAMEKTLVSREVALTDKEKHFEDEKNVFEKTISNEKNINNELTIKNTVLEKEVSILKAQNQELQARVTKAEIEKKELMTMHKEVLTSMSQPSITVESSKK